MHELQAAAAVGQMGLVQAYESAFAQFGLHTAQILLTHDDLADRRRYLNARSTLVTLLALDVIPIINENDTVTTDEIRFGDNDTLGALVTNLIEADVLVLLTDQQGLYTADPRRDPTATLVRQRAGGRSRARGDGRRRRHRARARRDADQGAGRQARRALRAHRRSSRRAAKHDVLRAPRRGRADRHGARRAEPVSLGARKQWLADHLQLAGRAHARRGRRRARSRATGRACCRSASSASTGEFERGEVVGCFDADGREIARGLVNYSAQETARILRKPSSEIEAILGYVDEPELIHRDNLVLLGEQGPIAAQANVSAAER